MSEREAFTAIELAFFRAGAETETKPVESFTDLDEGYERRPFLRRLFSRKQTQR